MFRMFLAGNALYYIAGIALAFAFKDNRAFCKYLCPDYGVPRARELFFTAARPLR